MNDPWPQPLCELSHAQHGTPVVVELDDVSVFNAACFSVRRVNADSPPRVAVF